MKEYFILADTHGFYTELMAALTAKGFKEDNPDHIVILCGDMLDRGLEAERTVEFFHKLFKEDRFVFVRGNHEDLFDDMIRRRYISSIDVSNGTLLSLYQLANPDEQIKNDSKSRHYALYKAKLDFFRDTTTYNPCWDELKGAALDFYETKNYIFVHGWLPVIERTLEVYEYDKDWRNATKGEWANARWLNGMQCAEQGVIEPDKTIVCGHWHTSYANVLKLDPTLKRPGSSYYEFDDKKYTKEELMQTYYGNGIIALDACTAWSGFCNCLHLTEEEI